jgi:hypothetical protein
MTVTKAQRGYYLFLDGTTTEVLTQLITEGNPKIAGYFVDVATGTRYIVASKRG